MLKLSQRFVRALLALCVCLELVACGSAGEPLAVEAPLPIATVGTPYKASLLASGGTAPLQWQVTQGALPQGLTLDPSSGEISGEVLQTGRVDFEVTVRDAQQRIARTQVRMDAIEADVALVPGTPQATSPAVARQLAMATPEAALVNLVASIPEGSWVQASLNRYADVWTPEELRPLDVNGMGATAPSKIIAAWSSFAWDSNRADLILYGGGHGNHPGNDVYRWHASTRMWERAALPSEITKDASGNFMAVDGPDAAPSAAHTYDNNLFLPIVDRFLTFGGAAYNNGGAYRRATTAGQSRNTGPYLWDPAKGDPNKVGGTTGSHVKRVSPHPEVVGGQMWQNRDMARNLAGSPILPASHLEGCTGYASENGRDVVYVGARLGYGTATQLFRYVINDVNNPALDSWTQLGGYWSAPQGQTVCSFDPVQKLFVRVGNAGVPFTYWDTAATGGVSNYEKTIQYTEPSGELASRLASKQIDIRYCGFDFDPVRRQYALWCGGSEVWMLTPPATKGATGWQLSKQTIVAGRDAPTTDTGTGILGKWKYIPNLDAFMALQDSTAGNIWIYKPYQWQSPGGGSQTNVAPSVSWVTPVTGQQFAAGQVLALQASASDSDGSVAAVDFFDGTSLLAHVTAAPWRYDWTSAAVGTHVLTATAYDNLGASSTSASVTVQVNAGSAGLVVLQDGLNGYTGTQDVHLAGNAKNVNYGTATSMIDVASYYAMMVRFAIFNREGGPVPDNAIISAAELALYKPTAYSQTVSAYRMQCDWKELQATWNACRTGVPWTVGGAYGAGTDYLATPDGSGLVAWAPGWLSIDVSAAVVQMQAGAPNYGWRLRRSAGDDINTKRYYTREYTAATALRPKLTVRYALP